MMQIYNTKNHLSRAFANYLTFYTYFLTIHQQYSALLSITQQCRQKSIFQRQTTVLQPYNWKSKKKGVPLRCKKKKR